MRNKLFSLSIFILLSCNPAKDTISKSSSNFSISPAATTLLDVIVGKFPGVKVIGHNVDNMDPKILIRGGSLSINKFRHMQYTTLMVQYKPIFRHILTHKMLKVSQF